jgi:hypothetical protein
MLFEHCPKWTWSRATCCGLTVTEQYNPDQSKRFTARWLWVGPVKRDAMAGQKAVKDRMIEYFERKGCPHAGTQSGAAS